MFAGMGCSQGVKLDIYCYLDMLVNMLWKVHNFLLRLEKKKQHLLYYYIALEFVLSL